MSARIVIGAFPDRKPTDVFRRRHSAAALLGDFTRLFPSGTEALYWAFRGIRAQAGATAWIASFHCGVEPQAATDAGLGVRFFRVRPDLTVDVQHLSECLRDRPGPVSVIHYFGFPQPEIREIAELCRGYGVPLIEDCAHALFTKASGQAPGTNGPLAIFSLRKFFGLYDGGALAVSPAYRDAVGGEFHLPPAGGFDTRPYVIAGKDLGRRLVGGGLTTLYRRVRWGDVPLPVGADEGEAPDLHPAVADSGRYGYRMSALSRRLAGAVDIQRASELRRSNYLMLQGLLGDRREWHPVFPTLPEGTVPLAFPIWVSRRTLFLARLAKEGIEPYVFGEWPHPILDQGQFPETARFRREIVGLPIQQDLSREAMHHIASAVSAILVDHAPTPPTFISSDGARSSGHS